MKGALQIFQFGRYIEEGVVLNGFHSIRLLAVEAKREQLGHVRECFPSYGLQKVVV
jgi:hypothetical protein